jgi:hypothetical protein
MNIILKNSRSVGIQGNINANTLALGCHSTGRVKLQ